MMMWRMFCEYFSKKEIQRMKSQKSKVKKSKKRNNPQESKRRDLTTPPAQ